MAVSGERETADGQTTGVISADMGVDTLSKSIPYEFSDERLPYVGTKFRELGVKPPHRRRSLLKVLPSVLTSRFTRHHSSAA